MVNKTTALEEEEPKVDAVEKNETAAASGSDNEKMLDVDNSTAAADAASESDSVSSNSSVETTEIGNESKSAPNYLKMSLKEIMGSFEEMIARGNQQELYKNADLIKASFYKILRKEKTEAGFYSDDVAGPVKVISDKVTSESEEKEEAEVPSEVKEVVSNNPFEEIENAFKDLYSKYKTIRAEYLEKTEKSQEENLAIKNQIIEDINILVDKAEDMNHTFPAFRELQAKWKTIGSVPPQNSRKLWDDYQHAVEKFYDYIKLNNEFRDMDFKKNLGIKTRLCERAESLAENNSMVDAFKELQKLHEEWKETGPVAKECREPLWERFREATSVINKKHQKFFEQLKADQKNNLAEKAELCSQAEAFMEKEIKNSKEWNAMSKQMEGLQAKWKTIGFASKKENQKIYDRFRAACDKFYNAKREYYANFKNVMQENLAKKEKLCEQAETWSVSEEWNKATDELIKLQKQWKEIGPVTRKQSDIIWKRFRAACDKFFESKAVHFGKANENFSDNLAEKEKLIKAVETFELSDSREDNLESLRSFISQWSNIGFVPFKDKEAVSETWEKVLDDKFGKDYPVEKERKLGKFRRRVNSIRSSGGGDRSLKYEREKILQKYRKIESDIVTLENNMGFLAKSKNADALKVELTKKIEEARRELVQMEEKIKLIDNQYSNNNQ
ncbi:MAG: DUF349 domain-containing protein [Bacteroidales bacterium]|jgi:hypothetical protein|nr:DUF349 domain-containing protein [Bacteroidales bacterium]